MSYHILPFGLERFIHSMYIRGLFYAPVQRTEARRDIAVSPVRYLRVLQVTVHRQALELLAVLAVSG